ncbi:MAG: hypothetical protein OXB93_06680 [Cytophagales bacterium]|nr:hypothetical protein [Cytophagales bacterium]
MKLKEIFVLCSGLTALVFLAGCPGPEEFVDSRDITSYDTCYKYVPVAPISLTEEVLLAQDEQGRPINFGPVKFEGFVESGGPHDINFSRVRLLGIDTEKKQIQVGVLAAHDCEPSSLRGEPRLEDFSETWFLNHKLIFPKDQFGEPAERVGKTDSVLYDWIILCPKDSCLNTGIYKTFSRIAKQLQTGSVDSLLLAERKGDFETKELEDAVHVLPFDQIKIKLRTSSNLDRVPEDEDPEDGDPEDEDPEDGDPEDEDPEDEDPEDEDPEDGDPEDEDPEDEDPEDGDPEE